MQLLVCIDRIRKSRRGRKTSLKKVLGLFFVGSLISVCIMLSGNPSYAGCKAQFMTVSASVAEKCSVSMAGGGNSLSEAGAKVSCMTDSEYQVSTDTETDNSLMETWLYDSFTDQMNAQIKKENMLNRKLCSFSINLTEMQGIDADVFKVYVTW